MSRRDRGLFCGGRQVADPAAEAGGGWIDRETAVGAFRDLRHGKRLRRVLEQFSEKIGGSTPWVCQDWSATKAAYRFFSNRRVNEGQILSGHFQAVRERMPRDGRPVLVLHDTTELSYRRKDTKPIGILSVTGGRTCKDLEWYSMRWKIETFHKILKSGCRAEESKLRTAERLVNLTAVLCILSWRIFWMTMVHRAEPQAAPEKAFTGVELYLLDELVPDRPGKSAHSLAAYLIKLARLGGYLARTHDPPPGNMVT